MIPLFHHGGGFGGGGFTLMTRLYDQLGHLLLEGIGWLIHIKDGADVQADNDFNFEVINDANLTINNDCNFDVTGNRNDTVDDNLNCTIENDSNMTTNTGDINRTSGNDINVTASNDMNISAVRYFLGPIKSGATQAAAGAIAGEMWYNTTTQAVSLGV